MTATRKDIEALRDLCEARGYLDAVILIDVLLKVLHRWALEESKSAIILEEP